MSAYLLLTLQHQKSHKCNTLWSSDTKTPSYLNKNSLRRKELGHCNSQAKWSSNRSLQSTYLSGNREGWIQISLLIIFSLTQLFKPLPKLHIIVPWKNFIIEQTRFAALLLLCQKKVMEKSESTMFFSTQRYNNDAYWNCVSFLRIISVHVVQKLQKAAGFTKKLQNSFCFVIRMTLMLLAMRDAYYNAFGA